MIQLDRACQKQKNKEEEEFVCFRERERKRERERRHGRERGNVEEYGNMKKRRKNGSSVKNSRGRSGA